MLAAAYDYNPIASASGLLSALFSEESCENACFPGFSGGFCPTFTDSVCIKDSVRIDLCAGSGHILDYLFDVLMQIYTDYGYTTSEAARSIIENNLYGLDIDERADEGKSLMGLTVFSGDFPTAKDIGIARNYLTEEELKFLNNIVSGYFDFAEVQL